MKTTARNVLGIVILLLLLVPVFRVSAYRDPAGITIPVLTYHKVTQKPAGAYDFTPDQLESHLNYLRENHYQPITAAEFIALRKKPALLPAKPVILTFDDSYASHYTRVFPMLRKFGFKATFFIITSGVATTGKSVLTWDELAEMEKAGMDIESHTVSHPFLTNTAVFTDHEAYEASLRHELEDSKKTLEEHLGRKIPLLAYPYGWYNGEVEAAAISAGYQGIFTVDWGNNVPGENPLRIKRRVFVNTNTIADLERILNYRPLPIEIMSPVDTSILAEAPTIRFRLPNPAFATVEVQTRTWKTTLAKNADGTFSWPGIPLNKSGYHMVIVKASDEAGHTYLGSWGFDYKPVVKPVLGPEHAQTMKK